MARHLYLFGLIPSLPRSEKCPMSTTPRLSFACSTRLFVVHCPRRQAGFCSLWMCLPSIAAVIRQGRWGTDCGLCLYDENSFYTVRLPTRIMVRTVEKLLQPMILALQNVVDMNDHVFGVKHSTLNHSWQNLAIFGNCSIFCAHKPVGWCGRAECPGGGFLNRVGGRSILE
jgi:hypothetical protein